jgi:type I restriction enzyme S subunit
LTRFVPEGFAFVSEDRAREYAPQHVSAHDLVFTCWGTIGQVGIIPDDGPFEQYIISNKQLKLRVNEALANPLFCFYYFASPRYVEHVRGRSIGGAVPGINLGILKSLKIALPTRAVQDRVVAVLSCYDGFIENNRRRIALLEEAARLLYREWFVHFRFPGHEHVKIVDGLPEGWRPRTLAEVVEVVKDNVKPNEFAEDDIHIGLEHIPRRSFTLADWESASNLASSKTRFAEGDILFCKIRPYFHKVGFALRSGLASSDALVWRVLNAEDWPLAVCATSSDHFVAVASKTVREGSKMPRADWNVLKKYSLPKPPEGLLSVFNDSIRLVTAQCKTLALQNRALAEARDLLLPHLMNGEIAV